MLTYVLPDGLPAYEGLYRCIREDILAGRLQPGQKLPSKRSLAAQLKLSKGTVEAAYGQLLAEGYLISREKVGYFVENVGPGLPKPEQAAPEPVEPEEPTGWLADCTGGTIASAFPFSVWSKLLRGIMADYGPDLLKSLPAQGAEPLRKAIARHLYDFRSMEVSPEQIVVGAGTDFLYNLVVQLLGRDKLYATEEPGYGKIMAIYRAGGARCLPVPLDEEGLDPAGIGDARVLHITPAHHFPTGVVMSIRRRKALLEWANAQPGRYIIEDDYDSEFRFAGRPIPTLCSIDRSGRVIYINTFSKTIAPAMRISYMVLPPELVVRFRRELGFYSCTVPSFEQYTLAKFLEEGYFEKHINRMRKFYRTQRNGILDCLKTASFASNLQISEKDAGLHFLVRVNTHLSDGALGTLCRRAGIRIETLEHYYHGPTPAGMGHTFVVNYSGLTQDNARLAIARLEQLLRQPGTDTL